MENNDRIGWKRSLKDVSRKYYYVIAVMLIVIGLMISFFSSRVPDPTLSRFMDEVGIFFSAVIAVSLIYNIITKGVERQLFLNDLKEVLDKKLSDYSLKSNLPIIYEGGRLELGQKVEHLKRVRVSISKLESLCRP